MLATLFLVALGGAIGAVARYLTGLGALRVMGPGFPFGTLTVNIVGSFLMGVVAVLVIDKSGARFSPFLMTGLLGGFTTFSAFSLDAVSLWEKGATGGAAIYVVASVVLSLGGLVAGLAIARGYAL
jgi:CrcB protein